MLFRLARPAAAAFLIAAALCWWGAANGFNADFEDSLGWNLFDVCIGLLYAECAVQLWQHRRLGAWLALTVLLIWLVVAARWGSLILFNSEKFAFFGAALALICWARLPRASTQPPASGYHKVLVLLAAIGAITFAPLWSCHVGFGGQAEYHCHPILTPEHVH